MRRYKVVDMTNRKQILETFGHNVQIGEIRKDNLGLEDFDYSYPQEAFKYHTEDQLINEYWDVLFITPDILVCGDYTGSLVEKSNCKVVREKLNEIDPDGQFWSDVSWGYGAEGLHIRLALFTQEKETGEMIEVDCLGHCDDGEMFDKTICPVCNGLGYREIPEKEYPAQELYEMLISAIDDYPLMDEELHSEMEMEATDENWDNWAKGDFIRSISSWAGMDELYIIHDRLCKRITDIEKLFDMHIMEHKDEPCWCLVRKAITDLASEYCYDHCLYRDEFVDWIDNLEDLRERFETWREKANVYWENESGDSMHVDLDAVVEQIDFVELFKEYLEVKYGNLAK